MPTGPGPARADELRVVVFALYFTFGGITSLNDVMIPKLKSLFALDYGAVMLVQSAFFGAYFLVSLPAAAIVDRLGYLRAAVVGLIGTTIGCLLFVPASKSAVFGLFLLALFVLASGITIVQVIANPLISMLGVPATASSRLTFAQAFNSLGTAIFPYVGARLILGSSASSDASAIIGQTYLGLVPALLVLAAVVWFQRNRLDESPVVPGAFLRAFTLLARPRFAVGSLCIFLYVGAEVSIGSIMINYLMQSGVMGISAEAAGEHVPYYWGGAMVGRFIGAYLLRVFAPGKVLAGAAGSAIGLLLVSANTTGLCSGWALLAVGLCNSIMFPTIFSLACAGLAERSAEGSGIICMSIVGGAIVPLITGHVADLSDLKWALVVPAICYAVILGFGWSLRKAFRIVAGVV